jgi:hypothetical protein
MTGCVRAQRVASHNQSYLYPLRRYTAMPRVRAQRVVLYNQSYSYSLHPYFRITGRNSFIVSAPISEVLPSASLAVIVTRPTPAGSVA